MKVYKNFYTSINVRVAFSIYIFQKSLYLDTNTHAHKREYAHRDTHIQTYRNTCPHIHQKHTHTHTHTHTHIYIYIYMILEKYDWKNTTLKYVNL